ncbi:MAG: response regulator [bacterium]|nr:response regulator [bacterium]
MEKNKKNIRLIAKLRDVPLRWKINSIGVLIVLTFAMILYLMILPLLEEEKLKERKGKLRAVVNSVVSLMDYYEISLREEAWKNDPSMPKTIEEAKNVIIKNLHKMRYDKNEYFFILDCDGNMVMHPLKEDLEGKNMLKVTDPEGLYLFKEIVINAQRDGETFTSFLWQSKYSPTIFEPQTIYSKYFWPWDWIVSSGVYTQDIIDSRKEITITTTIYNGITAAAAMIILFIMVYISLTKPLKKMLFGINQISNGNLEYQIPIRSNDEIGYISQEFNNMLGHLKTSREKLEKSEKKHRNFFENIIVGLYQTTLEGEFLTVNPALSYILGYDSPADLLNNIHNIGEQIFVESSKRDEFANIIQKNGFAKGFEFKALCKDGSIIEVSVDSHIVQADDNTRYFEGMLSDITEKKQVVQLKIDRDAAEAANRAKSEFLANMSHEIRTPMNAVLGFAELLEEQVEEGQQKQYLSAISTGGKSLLRLINDILDLSKIESGKLEIKLNPVSISSIFTELELVFLLKIEEKGLDLQIEPGPFLPEALLLDELRLRQILFNLLGNAVKFTNEGFVKLSARTLNTYEGQKKMDLILTVEDSGIGIAEDQKDLIFNAFKQQTGQNMAQYGGTGLGLAITKRLIEMMEGEITVESEPGKGSTFTVILKNIEITSIAKQAEENDIAVNFISFKKGLILVTDDIESNRELVKGLLEHQDLDVIEAKNGKEAIDFMRLYKPDLVLMDMKMPVMNGYEAIKILKEDNDLRSIPIIAFTASALREQEHRIIELGCNGYLRKPVSKKEFFSELIRFLPYSIDGSEVKQDAREEKALPMEALSPEISARIPELLNILKSGITLSWERLNKGLIINDAEDFAKKIIGLGEEYQVNMLIQWGSELKEQVEVFDMEKIPKTLASFPAIVEKVEKLK